MIYQRLFPNALPVEYAAARIGDIRHSRGDPEKLRNRLRFSAQAPFEQGLCELALGGLTGENQN
jgi:UDP-glucose 4-epimerase